jgi:hypothetical protein
VLHEEDGRLENKQVSLLFLQSLEILKGLQVFSTFCNLNLYIVIFWVGLPQSGISL